VWKIATTLALSSALMAAAPTFDTVAPLLEKHCVSCHHTGGIAPMAFHEYKDIRPWARAIRRSVSARTMPPWHAGEKSGHQFTNDRSLAAAEIRTISEWADDGAKEGTKRGPLQAPKASSGWKLGQPDLIVRVPGMKVPAQGTLEYTFLVSPTRFAQEKWIAAAEWKIDERSVVHHMNAFVRPQGSSYVKDAPPGELYVASRESRAARKEDEREVDRRELLLGYEPGYQPEPWGEGRAKLLPKNADLVFEIHYTANGKAVTDYSELGIYFAKEPPRERVLTITPADAKLAIPPGADSHHSFAAATMRSAVTLLSMQPHMHLRGKAYRIRAVHPDGKEEVLLDVPRYDFRWQTTYFLKQPLRLAAGARLECDAWFDNSAANRDNPDPKATVRWGDQSWEEMNIGFMELVFDAKADADVVTLSGSTRPGSTQR
jgi:hypothetical protein